ncbi:DUF5329 family protein [Pontibacter roseus]|uniref:DUF5329 family protein n=1 Tax=Pontibacter roseus TaxID=336989 RepID=UPI00035F3E84|nr:DUF5329 family protein [Pontibacter roseus]
MHKILILAIAFSSVQGVAQQAVAQAIVRTANSHGTISEEQKVDRLIAYLRSLEGAIFIRNNSEYKPEQAASHLQSKWQKHGARVKTAEGFVLKLASESSSGTPYSIRFPDGKTLTCREALLQELQRIAGGREQIGTN